MNVRIAAMTLVVGFATAAVAQTTTLSIDPAHSEADFSITHMTISTVHGRFSGVKGTIVLDPEHMKQSSVEANIDVNTVDTGVEPRDKHLRSADFFDVAKYPTMTFKSTSVTKDHDGFKVDGDLTLHGVTKPVTLQMDEPSKVVTGMDGKPHRGFEATTTINRKDFGLTWNGTLKSGDAVLGDDVKVSLEIEAVQQ